MKKTSGRTNKNPIKKVKTKSLSNEVIYILLTGLWLIIIISLHTGRGGVLGNWINTLLFGVFGNMAYVYIYVALLITVLLLTQKHHALSDKKKIGAGITLITMMMLIAGLLDTELIFTIRNENYMSTMAYAIEKGLNQAGYGLFAAAFLYWLVFSIGRMGTGILLVTIASAAIWLTSPRLVLWAFAKLKAKYKGIQLSLKNRKNHTKKHDKKSAHLTLVRPDNQPDEDSIHYREQPQLLQYEPVRNETIHQYVIDTRDEQKLDNDKRILTDAGTENVDDVLKTQLEKKESGSHKVYKKPSLSLLKPKQMDYQKTDRRKMLSKAKLLEETLASFGVEAKVIKVTQGPTITRYELQPSKGVKVSKVVNLNDDIALNLAASSIRIEAPIPGKAAIGIEIPNEEVSMVPLRELLDTAEYNAFKNPLPFVLGKNIAGDPVVFDINKMPHLLVAGATGSGKSVCINTLILSLLFKSTPDEVKLLMIDPKVVELNVYNGIPHLMIPVVTDPKKATGALRWAVTEMEERYHKFADNGVRDIAGFNEKNEEKLPYIVVIIDELADLMLVAAKEVEDYICRLAQMARASGIHLIIATQRPSVDVITGIIKANIPSRVAFSVASQVDSRTILDMGGAEKLLGKGDMLFHPVGLSKPVRIQGAFVSDEEVKSVVEFLKEQSGEPEYEEEIIDKLDSVSEQSDENESDDVFQEALRIAYDNQQISISMLQRKLKMGYNRAARLIDEMEAKGYVGPNEGTKPRKVINRPISNNDYNQNTTNIQEE